MIDLPPVCMPRSTARIMKAPTNAPCQFESMPAINKALRMTSRKAEPMKAPKAVPAPQIKTAPPKQKVWGNARKKAQPEKPPKGGPPPPHQFPPADHGRRDDAQLIALPHGIDGRAVVTEQQKRG